MVVLFLLSKPKWQISEEWKILGSIMKTEARLARTLSLNIDSQNPRFQYEDWTFKLPQMDQEFFDQGVFDFLRFSKAFAKQNAQHVVAESVMFAVVAHFAVKHFPNTAAELVIRFSDQVSHGRVTISISFVNAGFVSDTLLAPPIRNVCDERIWTHDSRAMCGICSVWGE